MNAGAPPAEVKICASCGRSIEWRRRWADRWHEVRWCSDACRRRRIQPVDVRLEETIVALLDARSAGATICPSEAARVVDPDGWRVLMEPARRAARRLVASGKVVITQKGRVVDPDHARGPIRIRRA